MTPADVSDRLTAGYPHTKVAIPCEVRPGAFRSERQFVIACAGGEEYVGLCDAMYVSAERGLVCARIVGVVGGRVKVVVPGNDVVTVRAEEACERWEGAP